MSAHIARKLHRRVAAGTTANVCIVGNPETDPLPTGRVVSARVIYATVSGTRWLRLPNHPPTTRRIRRNCIAPTARARWTIRSPRRRLGPLVELLAQALVCGNSFLVDHDVLGDSNIRLQKHPTTQLGTCDPSVGVGFRIARHSGTIARVPIGVSICKKEKPPGTQSGAASVPLKSSPKKGIHRDNIPPYVRMSGQS